MFCPSCGKEIADRSSFCNFCGSKIELVANQPVTEPVAAPAEPVKEKKPKKKPTAIIIIAVVLALAIAAALFFILSGNKNNAMKNIDELSKSVVRVECFNKAGDLYCTGSGVVVFDSDKVITNYHVISGDCFTVTVTSDDGQSASVTQILVYDEDKDLALLQLETATSINPLPIGDSENLQRGEEVIAIGSPLGLLNTASTGIVSGFLEDGEINAIQTSAAISSGSSGGALLNKSGELIGITYAGFEGGENLNLAIPSYEVVALNEKQNPVTVEAFYESVAHCIDLEELLANNNSFPDGMMIRTSGYVSSIIPLGNPKFRIAYLVPNKTDVYRYSELDDYALYYSNLAPMDTGISAFIADNTSNNVINAHDYYLNDNLEELVRCIEHGCLRIYLSDNFDEFKANNVRIGDYVTIEYNNYITKVINPVTITEDYNSYRDSHKNGAEQSAIQLQVVLDDLKDRNKVQILASNNPAVISVN